MVKRGLLRGYARDQLVVGGPSIGSFVGTMVMTCVRFVGIGVTMVNRLFGEVGHVLSYIGRGMSSLGQNVFGTVVTWCFCFFGGFRSIHGGFFRGGGQGSEVFSFYPSSQCFAC